MNRHLRATALVSVVGACVVLAACSSEDGAGGGPDSELSAYAAPDLPVVQPVFLPDLSRNTESEKVSDQIRRQYDLLMETLEDPDATAAESSQAYGEMGKLLLATDYASGADVCFRNAQALAPRNRRWPYYLGHVARAIGAPAQAAEHFEQARQLQPDDVPTLVWLAEMHLEAGDPGAARPLLEYALALRPDSLAIRFGLGRVALARQDFLRAVQHLEEARALNPTATQVLTALASAYRNLGRQDIAEARLQQRYAAARAAAHADAQVIIRPTDPLLEDVEGLVKTAAAYELRGSRAMGRGNYREASTHFRNGLELEPASPSLRHNLGTALVLRGDVSGGQEQFERIVQQSPEYARAHYSLGVLMEDSGQFIQALGRYTAAVRHDPRYAEARLRLAWLLRGSGQPDDAMAQYEWIMELDPLMVEAPFGYAMVLVSLERWAEARDRLADGIDQYPHAEAFPLALARVLAAAPDRRVRDGQRAMMVSERLSDEQQQIDLGETRAMVLAAVGRYEEAAAKQRDAIDAARAAGLALLAERMAANLTLYEAEKPSRTPWRDGELP